MTTSTPPEALPASKEAEAETYAEAEARIMQEYRWGNLTKLGVANHLKRAGFRTEVAIAKSNALAPAHPPTDAGVSEAAKSLLASLDTDTLNPEQFNAWHALDAALSTAIPAGDGVPPGMVERAREIVKANTSLPPDAVTAGLYDDTEAMRCTLAALSHNEGDRK